MRTGVLLCVAACSVGAPSAAPADPPGQASLEVAEARLEAGSLAVEIDRGKMDRDGTGSGAGVRATTPGEDPPLEIVAETTTWDLRGHTASFRTNVVLTRGPLQLTADALDLVLRPGPDPQVTDALASGSVIVSRGSQAATADKAELDAASGVLVLTGTPRLRDGPHTLQGDRIRFWLDGDRIECEACRVQVQGGVGLP